MLEDLDCWVLDALRRTPHPSHAHLEKSLAGSRAAPRRAVLTNMHIDMDYRTVADGTPDHVAPAHDGMVISYDV
jgi:phosphoribosyl 1,2-cyclic phosphate phosphodiesterase